MIPNITVSGEGPKKLEEMQALHQWTSNERLPVGRHRIEVVTAHLDPNGLREQVTEALKANGFGVLTKIDVDFRPYVTLGACNPKLAHTALQGEPAIGLLLPCNVVVQETDGATLVSFADPKAMFQIVPDAPIGEVAPEARNLLENAKDRL